MKECDNFRGSKRTLTHPTYFQGSRPQPPRIYTPVKETGNSLQADPSV